MSKQSIMLGIKGFKIKSYKDVEIFIEKCIQENSIYSVPINSELAYFIDTDKDKNITIYEKIGNISDPFNPMVEISSSKNSLRNVTIEEIIFKLRKFINKKYFN